MKRGPLQNFICRYKRMLFSGGDDRLLYVYDCDTLRKIREPIKLQNRALASLVVDKILIVAGMKFIQMFSLPNLTQVALLATKRGIYSMISSSRKDVILCGQACGICTIVSVKTHRVISEFKLRI